MYYLIVAALSCAGFVFFAETINPWPTGRYNPRKYGRYARKRKLGFWSAMVMATTGLIISFLIPASALHIKLIVVLVIAVPCSLLPFVAWRNMAD